MSSLDRLRESLSDLDLSAMVLSNMPSIRWLTGFSGSFGLVVVTADSGVLITDSRYTLQAAEQCSVLPTVSFANPKRSEEVLREQVEKLGIRRLGLDHNHVTVAARQKWQDQMPGVELIPVDDPVDQLRMIKSSAEVDLIRAACRITDDALEMLLAKLRPGVSERELFWVFEDFLRQHGATAAFPPIIVSGPNTARPHGEPGDRRLESGDFITFDIGARRNGYCSDITRTVVLGTASDRQREVYEQLLKAQQACVVAMKPGINGRDVDALARRILDEKSLGQYFGHGLGHGLGALVHDTGRLSPVSDQLIEAGQIWTIEPGVYIPDFGGARIEDDIAITDSGCEVLTHFPKHLIEVAC